jgi:hypothetical protein
MDWCSYVERDWDGLRAVEFRGWRLWSEGLLVEWIGRVEGWPERACWLLFGEESFGCG